MARFFLPFFACVILVSTALQSPAARAVSEIQYDEQMNALVWPFWATGVDGSFKGKDGFNIKYRKWENPQESGAIVILPGRAEPFFTYAETVYDLAQKGYSVYTLDHRGQGSSDRLLANPQLGHVEHFDDYVYDAKVFVDTVVNSKPHEKRFLLAPSMGGAVATVYCHQYPKDFTAMALLSPMFQIITKPYTSWEADLLTWWNILTGKAREYAPTQHDFDTNETFESNHLTQSRARWQTDHTLETSYPVLQNGGGTNLWVREARGAGIRIHDFASEFETPILLMNAGQDKLVMPEEQDYFCHNAKRCIQVPIYPDSEHEIWKERDSIRDDAFSQIFQFYSEF